MRTTTDTSHVNSATAKQIKLLHTSNWLQPKKLSVNCVSNAILFPGDAPSNAGIYANNTLIESTRLDAWQNVPQTLSEHVSLNANIITDPVIYIGVLYDCWGHCLTDEMKFLWVFLHPDTLPVKFRNAKCIYAVSPLGHSLPTNFKSLLSTLGIQESRLIPISKPTKLISCCIPDECFWLANDRIARFYTREYEELFDHICSYHVKEEHQPERKIYLTRTGWHKWEFGEQFIEAAFSRHGYEIIHPEKLTFNELVALLQQTKYLAATEGSCAHNSIFLRPGTSLIIIRKHDFCNRYQVAINKVRGLHVTYIDANLSVLFYNNKARNAGPFFMYVNRQLADFLGEKPTFPVGTFAHYISFCLLLRLIKLASPIWMRVKTFLGIPQFRLLKNLNA